MLLFAPFLVLLVFINRISCGSHSSDVGSHISPAVICPISLLDLAVIDDLTDAEVDAFDDLFNRCDRPSNPTKRISVYVLKSLWRKVKKMLRSSMKVGVVLKQTRSRRKSIEKQRRASLEEKKSLPRIYYIDRFMLRTGDETLNMLDRSTELSRSF